EAGNDVMAGKAEGRVSAGRNVGTDFNNASVIDGQRTWRQNPIGQHQRGARQDDHGWVVAIRAAPIAAASSPSAAGTIERPSSIARGRRRLISRRTGSST